MQLTAIGPQDYTPLKEKPILETSRNPFFSAVTTIGKVTFGTFVAAGMGVVSWQAALLVNEPDSSQNAHLVANTVGVSLLSTAFMAVGVASRFFNRNDVDGPSSYLPGPLTLSTVACLGYPIGVKQQYDAAVLMYNNLTEENDDITASNKLLYDEYKEQIEVCYDHVSDNIEEYMRPGCTLCLESYTTTLHIDDVYLSERARVMINQTLCTSPSDNLGYLWDKFTSYTLNQTRGEWPCGFPILNNSATEFADRTILGERLAVYPPFSVEVIPLDSSCKWVTGYGYRPYFPRVYCLGVTPNSLPNDPDSCLTSEFFDYIHNYTATFQPYKPSAEVNIPSIVNDLVKGFQPGIQYIACSGLGLFFLIGSIGFELRKCGRNAEEQKPLITRC